MEENLRTNKAGYKESDTHRECTMCGVIFEKRRADCPIAICKPCNSTRVKGSYSAEYKMWMRAKTRAREQGIPFDIEVSDIVIPSVCPVLGIPMKINSGRPGAFMDSPSLDKIVPSKGYVKGNIQMMSQLANQMKGRATEAELLKFAEWILKTYS